jgi:hypothetical protein
MEVEFCLWAGEIRGDKKRKLIQNSQSAVKFENCIDKVEPLMN